MKTQVKKSKEQLLIENVTASFKAKGSKLRSEFVRTIDEECAKLNLSASQFYMMFGM